MLLQLLQCSRVCECRYGAVLNDALNTAKYPASFTVSYNNDPAITSSFWYSWQTILIVILTLVGGPIWIWRVLLYMRKKANQPMDIELIVYGIMAAADVFSFALCIVLLLVSLAGSQQSSNMSAPLNLAFCYACCITTRWKAVQPVIVCLHHWKQLPIHSLQIVWLLSRSSTLLMIRLSSCDHWHGVFVHRCRCTGLSR